VLISRSGRGTKGKTEEVGRGGGRSGGGGKGRRVGVGSRGERPPFNIEKLKSFEKTKVGWEIEICIPRKLSTRKMASEPAYDACRSLLTGTIAKSFPSCKEGASTSSVCDASCSFVLPPIEDYVDGELVSLEVDISLLLLFYANGRRFL